MIHVISFLIYGDALEWSTAEIVQKLESVNYKAVNSYICPVIVLDPPDIVYFPLASTDTDADPPPL